MSAYYRAEVTLTRITESGDSEVVFTDYEEENVPGDAIEQLVETLRFYEYTHPEYDGAAE